jgi:hypothetical protein
MRAIEIDGTKQRWGDGLHSVLNAHDALCIVRPGWLVAGDEWSER